jgi:imidazolonepropionase-like amidohydrolase
LSSEHPNQTSSRAGFIDAHTHLTHPEALQDLARAGITAARDAGTRQGSGLALKRTPVQGNIVRIITAGRALSKRGGYGAFLGTPVETRREISAEILKLRNEGADIIKIIASGMVSFELPGMVTAGGFGADDVRFIVEEAGSYGLAVMAHANGEQAIRAAAEAGVRSIEHGFFMTEAALQSLQDGGVFWVPTVGALRRAAELAEVRTDVAAVVQREIERHLVMLGKAFRAGVPLAVGTDCVLPDRRYRGYYEDELALFRGSGIPADAVERIACEGGAKLLGI